MAKTNAGGITAVLASLGVLLSTMAYADEGSSGPISERLEALLSSYENLLNMYEDLDQRYQSLDERMQRMPTDIVSGFVALQSAPSKGKQMTKIATSSEVLFCHLSMVDDNGSGGKCDVRRSGEDWQLISGGGNNQGFCRAVCVTHQAFND